MHVYLWQLHILSVTCQGQCHPSRSQVKYVNIGYPTLTLVITFELLQIALMFGMYIRGRVIKITGLAQTQLIYNTMHFMSSLYTSFRPLCKFVSLLIHLLLKDKVSNMPRQGYFVAFPQNSSTVLLFVTRFKRDNM